MLHFIIGFILGGIIGAYVHKGYVFLKSFKMKSNTQIKQMDQDLGQSMNMLNELSKGLRDASDAMGKPSRDRRNY